MWQLIASRRELLELLLAGQPVRAKQSGEVKQVALAPEEVLLLWENQPLNEPPSSIVFNDDQQKELLAALISSPQSPTPLTAFSRLVPVSFLKQVADRPKPTRDVALNGLSGMALAEAMLYSGASHRTSDLTPAATKRTVAFAFGRALQVLPPETLATVLPDWLEVQSIVGSPARQEQMHTVCAAFAPIFYAVAELYFGLPPSSLLSSICAELLESDELSTDLLQELASQSSIPVISLLSTGPREERALKFQDAIRLLRSNASARPLDAAVCAYLASRIAPGSFEHLAMLSDAADPSLAGWYGLFASLQRKGSALRGYGALGLRVRKEMNNRETFHSAPVADIGMSELRVLSRSSLDLLSRKLGHSNEIVVEIAPLVACSFRFGQRSPERHSDLFGMEARQAPKELSNREKFDLAMSLLSSIPKATFEGESSASSKNKTKRR